MNNLKPLVWSVNEIAATINITAESPLHNYTIYPDQYEGGYVIYYFERMTSESGREYFNSSDEAQEWAQFTHYPSKMQPYIKPSPTWIDASEQLPNVDRDTQFICAYDSAIDTFSKVAWFNADIGEFNYQHDDVLAWMPIPEFKQGE